MREISIFRTVGLPLVTAVFLSAAVAAAPEQGQRTFATPHEAAQALLAAAESDNMPGLSNIFGPAADEILNSGDPVEDRNNRIKFVTKAKQSLKEQIDPANANRARLLIGADRFPFPIPLMKTAAGRWYFDTPAGKAEILARRIGSNELDAIAACRAYVAAQYDYAAEDRNGNGIPEYARKLISSPDQRDGLFWPGDDMPRTAFAARVETAESEGYRKKSDGRTPYHGYYYKILLRQGVNARGGALDYIQDDSMIGGFALVAWPAEHGVSGIKTFLVNQDGVIYEKDLGAKTNELAEAMTTYNPDRTWRRVR
jgi:Protein of unknown function (DUF2950)